VIASELFDREAQRQEVGPRPAVLLGKRETEESKLAHLLDRVERELMLLVPALCVRPHGLVDERTNGLLELPLFRSEV
jgi:hypothetical protein